MAGVSQDPYTRIITGVLRESNVLGSIYTQCFPKQLAYVTDASSLVASICSRKAGKTGGNVRKLVTTALRQSGNMSVYACQTIESAFAAIWDNPDGLPAWLARNHVPCKVFEEGLVEFPNESLIRVTGINSRKTADVWRSIRTNVFELDEGQAWDDKLLAYVLEEVIPATQLVRGGQTYISGTPDRRCRGYFYDITTGRKPGWSIHKNWTWRDNPHLLNAKEWMEEEKRKRGLTEDSPAFRREFNGEWAGEDSALAYRYDSERNSFDALPTYPEWTNILGIDLGFNDAAAFSLGCYSPQSPVLFVKDIHHEKGAIVSRYDEIIRSYKQSYDISRIVMDCGALGKTIAEELRQRFRHVITPAEKKEKATAMALFNDALRTGTVKVDRKRCRDLIEQWANLQLDEEGKEDPYAPNDLADATLYMFRHARAYMFEPPEPARPHPGRRAPPAPEVIAARMLERAEERAMREKSSFADEASGLLGELEPLSESLFDDYAY